MRALISGSGVDARKRDAPVIDSYTKTIPPRLRRCSRGLTVGHAIEVRRPPYFSNLSKTSLIVVFRQKFEPERPEGVPDFDFLGGNGFQQMQIITRISPQVTRRSRPEGAAITERDDQRRDHRTSHGLLVVGCGIRLIREGEILKKDYGR